MFRIAFMTEDRKLADVLRMLSGQAHNLEVVPVVLGESKVSFAKPIGDGTPARKGRKSTRKDISPTGFGMKKGQTFAYRDLVPLMKKMGMSDNSTWYCTKRMLEEKTIKRISTGNYEVI